MLLVPAITAAASRAPRRGRAIKREFLSVKDPAATFDDLCAAVTTLEDTERTARRVMGGAHPITTGIELSLRNARAVLHRSETSRT